MGKKNNETHFGYKAHVKVDSESKLIVKTVVTSSSVHDSQVITELLDDQDNTVYADSAYTGHDLTKNILNKCPKAVLLIHEKGYRGNPLSNAQKACDTAKSRIRCRVEHVFGHIQTSMGGLLFDVSVL